MSFNMQKNIKILISIILVLLIFQTGLTFGQTRGVKILTKIETESGEIDLYENSLALLIGIDQYDDDFWPDLKNPVRDIKSINEVLIRQGFMTTMITDETQLKPTYKNVLDAFKKIHSEAGEKDRVVIFYAGHGESRKQPYSNDYSGFIVPQDANSDWTSFIRMDDISGMAEDSHAKHIMYLFDSCFSGLFVDITRSSQKLTPDITKKISNPTRIAICAGSHDEPVVDGEYHSPFCSYFLKAFEEGNSDFNKDGYLTGSELAMYLSQNISRDYAGNQNPQWGRMMKYSKGDIVFELPDVMDVGEIIVKTDSYDDVDVYIDNQLKRFKLNADNVFKMEVFAGEHVVEVVGKDGTHTENVYVQPGENHYIDAFFYKEGTGTMQIFSDITSKSDVYINDKLLNEKVSKIKPLIIEQLKAGKYFVKVISPAFADSDTVLVKTDSKINFYAELSAMSAVPVEPDKNIYRIELPKIDFIQIPGGTFLIGAVEGEDGAQNDEIPRHEVKISSFYLSAAEVSQELWTTVMGYNPSKYSGDKLPVESVSWNDCQTFIKKLNEIDPGKGYRLPTEAEWEYACRAGSASAYNVGDKLTEADANFNYGSEFANLAGGEMNDLKTRPAASFAPNAWGLYDIHGNVCEWVQDWYGEYSSAQETDPRGSSTGSLKVHRGGSYMSIMKACRSANRNKEYPYKRLPKIGFRIAKTNP